MDSAVASPRTARIELKRDGSLVRVRTHAYGLEIDTALGLTRAPTARLQDAAGRKWSDLSLLASAHTRGDADETVRVLGIDVDELDDGVRVRVRASSSVWARRDLVLRCTADAVELTLEVVGDGELAEVTMLGGRGAMPNGASGTFRSDIRFRGVLVPAATEPVALVRPPEVPASLGVVGDADAGRLNAVFSPPPLALGLSREAATGATDVPTGDWLGLWLRAPVTELSFTALQYLPLDGGFLLQLDYEGHTRVDATWRSPTVVLRPTATGWGVLEGYRDDLAAHDLAPGPSVEAAVWWLEPIFCGWGAQCARAARAVHADTGHEVQGEVATVRAAPLFARQDVYDDLLSQLSGQGVEPGTIVIDDRWQASYGTGEVDPRHWPDLRGWIADRHRQGRRVLLWWKAWDAEGVPAEECVLDAAGDPVCVDPGSAAYRQRLAAVIRHLLSPDGLDADGLKIDFTQRGPSGRSLTGTPGVWGIAALHRLLATIEAAAHDAKPDALLIAHAVHPSFGDVLDMVRLNDVAKRDVHRRRVPVVDQLTMRHAVASRVLPQHPIDTDQWPMPNRRQWRRYVAAQGSLGVPALYYVEAMDRSDEQITADDLRDVAASWSDYRAGLP